MTSTSLRTHGYHVAQRSMMICALWTGGGAASAPDDDYTTIVTAFGNLRSSSRCLDGVLSPPYVAHTFHPVAFIFFCLCVRARPHTWSPVQCLPRWPGPLHPCPHAVLPSYRCPPLWYHYVHDRTS